MSVFSRLFRKEASGKVMTKPSLPPGERIYAVGDVHGRFDLLARLSYKIFMDAEERPADSVSYVFLGDYVDRGPESGSVIEFLLSHVAKVPGSIFLKGNHEEALLRFLDEPMFLKTWLSFGGRETLSSYGIDLSDGEISEEAAKEVRDVFASNLPKEHLAFLSSLKLSHNRGSYFFVHAGIRPGMPIENQHEDDMIWIREPFLSSQEDFGKIVVHGHTPIAEPEIKLNRVCVDTGAIQINN